MLLATWYRATTVVIINGIVLRPARTRRLMLRQRYNVMNVVCDVM